MASATSGPPEGQDQLQRNLLQRLRSRLLQVTQRLPLDVGYLKSVFNHEIILLRSLSGHLHLAQDVVSAINVLSMLLNMEQTSDVAPLQFLQREMGRPKYIVSPEHLEYLINLSLPISCISEHLGLSKNTVKRRIKEYGLSNRPSYSNLSDEELDNMVKSVKERTPHIGYQMMKGTLQAMGHHVQWQRIAASMHRVDPIGVLMRMTRMGCVARRTYSVKGPLHLVHIDTNHKLIRYGFVIFGGIDGYSRKIMYLGAANNNKASTALDFFLEAAQKYGFPLRIERLWRDVWMAVSNVYYGIRHSLEDEGVLNPSDSIHLFCAQHVFLPRLQRDLDVFRVGWDSHPLRTEQNLFPHQLWTLGLLQNPVDSPDQMEESEDSEPGLNYIGNEEDPNAGVVLPPIACPLTEQDMADLRTTINVTRPTESNGRDIYLEALNYVLNHIR